MMVNGWVLMKSVWLMTDGIGSEVRLPVVEAQHGDEIRVLGFVGRYEQAAYCRTDAEGFEVISRNQLAAGHVRLVIPAYGDVLLVVSDDVLHHLVLLAQVAVHGVGKVIVVVAAVGVEVAGSISCPMETYQLLGMAHGQRPQQGLIEKRKHGGVCADAQRQGDHRDMVKTGAFRICRKP